MTMNATADFAAWLSVFHAGCPPRAGRRSPRRTQRPLPARLHGNIHRQRHPPDPGLHHSAEATEDSTGDTLTMEPDNLTRSTELGYAATAHRAQGITVDTGHTVVKTEQSRELFYVAMTLGKLANYAYVDLAKDDHPSPDQWNLVHKTPGTYTAVGALKAVLDHSIAERAAH